MPPEEGGPRAAVDYPGTWHEFLRWFPDDAACLAYLERLRWTKGLRLPPVLGPKGLADRRWSLDVRELRAAELGHGRNHLRQDTDAAHDLVRRCLVRDQPEVRSERPRAAAGARARQLPDRLDDAPQAPASHGSPRSGSAVGHGRGRRDLRRRRGTYGRETATKSLVAVAAEERGRGIGRIRMRRIPNASGDSLEPFIAEVVEPGAVVHTDGWGAYVRVGQLVTSTG